MTEWEEFVRRGGLSDSPVATVYIRFGNHKPEIVKYLKQVIPGTLPYALFGKQVSIWNQLSHPAIPSLLQNIEYQGKTFVFMRYFPGTTLELVMLKVKTLPLFPIVDTLIRLCDALEYMHSFGVVHGNVCPGNIVFRTLGIGLIGLSRMCDIGPIGQILPRLTGYEAPEQLDGNVTLQSDVYSVGRTLEGILKFNGIVGDDGALDQLEKIVSIATAQASSQRYSSISEFRSALIELRNF